MYTPYPVYMRPWSGRVLLRAATMDGAWVATDGADGANGEFVGAGKHVIHGMWPQQPPMQPPMLKADDEACGGPGDGSRSPSGDGSRSPSADESGDGPMPLFEDVFEDAKGKPSS